MHATAIVLPLTGSPKLARVVAVAIFFHCSFSCSLPAFFSFTWSCAFATARHDGFGVVPHRETQAPPASCFVGLQLVHAVGPAPEQLRHDASQGAQAASLLAVQTSASYVPAAQVEHESQVVCPSWSWNVPAVQPAHDVAPTLALAVPIGHPRQVLAAEADWNVPAPHESQTVCPGVEAKLPAPHCEHTVDPDPFEKKPGPQSGHVLAPIVALAVPGAQFWHVLEPVAD